MDTSIPFTRLDDPPKRKRVVPIKQVGATDQLTLVILSPNCHGYVTHWTGKKTVPCLGGPKLCEHHLKQVPVTWRGYLHVCLQFDPSEQYFIELTEFTLERIKKLQGDRPSLRGMICCFSRERKQRNAPIMVVHVGDSSGYKQLPREQAPDETLARIWNLK